MSELIIPKIETTDISAPHLKTGESAIVLQRHERYERDPAASGAGSLVPEHAEKAFERDVAFFSDLFGHDSDGQETILLFVSSDTQYAGGGYRSLETAQIAQDAAAEVLERLRIDPASRIINLSPNFKIDMFEPTGQAVRADAKIREPQIFDTPEYVNFLREKYGKEEGPGMGLSPRAWAIHEMDAEKDMRERLGAEGVYEVLDRTKKSLGIMARYASIFHAHNSDKKLLIWAASHYDTISPLVKDATEVGFGAYVPVDYGAGVVVRLDKDKEPVLEAQNKKVILNLAGTAINLQE